MLMGFLPEIFRLKDGACFFVCLFDTPGADPWTSSPLAAGWQTWEDHAALPTNGLARESNNMRGSFSARTNYLLERTWRTGLHREVHLRASTDAEVRRDEPLRLLHDGSTLVLEFRGCQAPQKTPKNGNAPQKTAMRGTGRRGRLQELTFSEIYWARRTKALVSRADAGLPSTTRRVDSR